MDVIYVLHCPVANRIRYIGKSQDADQRLRGHLSDGWRDSHKARWIQKLSREGKQPELRILFCVPPEMGWQVAERFFIAAALHLALPITNRTRGGDGLSFINEEDKSRWRRSLTEARIASWQDEAYRERTIQLSIAGLAKPEVRAKMSVIRTAIRNDPKALARQSEVTKQMWTDPDVRAKISAGIKAAWADPEKREKHRAAIRASLASPEARAIKRARSLEMWARRKAAQSKSEAAT